jgi:hypothetical protein
MLSLPDLTLDPLLSRSLQAASLAATAQPCGLTQGVLVTAIGHWGKVRQVPGLAT